MNGHHSSELRKWTALPSVTALVIVLSGPFPPNTLSLFPLPELRPYHLSCRLSHQPLHSMPSKLPSKLPSSGVSPNMILSNPSHTLHCTPFPSAENPTLASSSQQDKAPDPALQVSSRSGLANSSDSSPDTPCPPCLCSSLYCLDKSTLPHPSSPAASMPLYFCSCCPLCVNLPFANSHQPTHHTSSPS